LIQPLEREDDPRLEPYRHVGDAAWLRTNDLFVAEGRLVVERLIAGGGYTIESVLVTPAAFHALERSVSGIAPVYVADPRLVNGITGFNFHRGCLAIVRRPSPRSLADFVEARRLIVLEGIGNPDNVGGIFRSAAALGADGVILDPTSSDPLYRKAVRTSMGAVLRLPFTRVESWPESLHELRTMGFTVAALAPGGATTVDRFADAQRVDTRLAFLAGAEGPGLSEAARALADVTVRIPVDPRSDSLNVVVAVSIALQRLTSPTA
jgi:tRNA G18 (ribose-2'-O)-methylase SpoU